MAEKPANVRVSLLSNHGWKRTKIIPRNEFNESTVQSIIQEYLKPGAEIRVRFTIKFSWWGDGHYETKRFHRVTAGTRLIDMKDATFLQKFLASRYAEISIALSPKLGLQRKLGEGAVALPQFEVEWENCSQYSELLYSLFRNLQAPEKYLDACISAMEVHLQHVFANAYLVVRGSVASGLALKTHGDIDLDLVLPHSYKTKEQFDAALNKVAVAGDDDCIDPADTSMKDLCVEILNAIERNDNVTIDFGLYLNDQAVSCTVESSEEGLEVNGDLDNGDVDGDIEASFYPFVVKLKGDRESISRGLPLEVVVDGFPIDVDLFPKFLDSTGRMCGISKVQWVNGNKCRQWEYRKPYQRAGVALTDNEKAAVLFLKFWKLSRNEIVQNGVKGYHIAVTMMKIVATRGICWRLKSWWCGRGGKFDRRIIIRNMLLVVQQLKAQYSCEGATSPFLQDTGVDQQETFSNNVTSALNTLETTLQQNIAETSDRVSTRRAMGIAGLAVVGALVLLWIKKRKK